MDTKTQITFKVNYINLKEISLTVFFLNSDKEQSNAKDFIIKNPLTKDLEEKIVWLLESHEENRIHELAINMQIESAGSQLYEALFNIDFFNEIELSQIYLKFYSPSSFPWEILYDSKKQNYLITEVKGFSRVNDIEEEITVKSYDSPIRILLIISRPFKFTDVQFRSIANRIVTQLKDNENYILEVLRPATFEEFKACLKKAQNEKKPFNIVHFDGHGVHGSEGIPGLHPSKGYILFEDQKGIEADFLDGNTFGQILVNNGVSVLILNSCRSGYKKGKAINIEEESQPVINSTFNSFADDVISTGIESVVAMKYKILVEDAIHFTEFFYKSLSEGESIESSYQKGIHGFSKSNKSLSLMPILFQSKTVFFNKKQKSFFDRLINTFKKDSKAVSNTSSFDDWIIRIEKVFQQNSKLFLTGMLGSGKSTLVKEFGTWALLSKLTDHVVYIKVDDDLNEVVKNEKIDFNKRYLFVIGYKKSNIMTSNFVENFAIPPKILYFSYVVPESLNNDIININLNKIEIDSLLSKKGLYNERTHDIAEINSNGNPIAYHFINENLESLLNDSPIFSLKKLGDSKILKNLTITIKDNFSDEEQKALAVFSFLPKYLNKEQISILTDVLKEFFSIQKHNFINKVLRLGIIGCFNLEVNNEYQFHSILKIYFQEIFKEIWPLEIQQQILINIISFIFETSATSNPFLKKKIALNYPTIINNCIDIVPNVNLMELLQVSRKRLGIDHSEWRLLIENAYNTYHKKNTHLSEKSEVLNFIVISYYYIEYNREILNHEKLSKVAERLIIQINDPKYCENLNEYFEHIHWLIKALLLYVEEILEILKIDRYEKQTHYELIELLEKFILMSNSNGLMNLDNSKAKTYYLLAELYSLRIKNYSIWHANLESKSEESEKYTNHLTSFYFSRVNFPGYKNVIQSMKYLEDLLKSKLTSLKSIDKPLSDNQYFDFEGIILGFRFQENYTQAKDNYEKAIHYGNSNFKEIVSFSLNEMIKAIRGKLLYCFLNDQQIRVLVSSSITTNVSNVERFLFQNQQEYQDEEMELYQYVQEKYPLEKQMKLEENLEEAKKHMLYGEYSKAIKLYEKLQDELPIYYAPLKNIIFNCNFLCELYTNTDPMKAFEFFDTPVLVYLQKSWDELSLSLLLREYIHVKSNQTSPYSFDQWLKEHLKEADEKELFSYSSTVVKQIFDYLTIIKVKMEEEIKTHYSMLSITNQMIEKLEAMEVIDNKGKPNPKTDLSKKNFQLALFKIDDTKNFIEKSIRLDHRYYESKEYLIKYEILYISFLHKMKCTVVELFDLLERAQRLTDLSFQNLEKYSEVTIDLLLGVRETYLELIEKMLYEQDRLFNKRLPRGANKKRKYAIKGCKLILDYLERYSSDLVSPTLKDNIDNKELNSYTIKEVIFAWSYVELLEMSDDNYVDIHLNQNDIEIAKLFIKNMEDFFVLTEESSFPKRESVEATINEFKIHWDVMELFLTAKNKIYHGGFINLRLLLESLKTEFNSDHLQRGNSNFKSKLIRNKRKVIIEIVAELEDYYNVSKKNREELAKTLPEDIINNTQENTYE